MTQAKPTTVDVRIAHIGTPRLLMVSIRPGASLRADRTNSIRDAVYSPELRQDSTAVRTTTFMKSAAPGMPICSMAATYGDSPSFVLFHGRIVASRKIEPTKKMEIRKTTELVAFAIPRSGSADSAAAMVAISAPTIEKTFVAVISPMRTKDTSHNGTSGNHRCRIPAPATASNPTTITQKYQYSHPTLNPAQPPSAC